MTAQVVLKFCFIWIDKKLIALRCKCKNSDYNLSDSTLDMLDKQGEYLFEATAIHYLNYQKKSKNSVTFVG